MKYNAEVCSEVLGMTLANILQLKELGPFDPKVKELNISEVRHNAKTFANLKISDSVACRLFIKSFIDILDEESLRAISLALIEETGEENLYKLFLHNEANRGPNIWK